MNFLIYYCFILLRLQQQSTTDWVAYKQQKVIFHSSGGWEVQYQGSGNFRVWWELSYLVHRY